MTANISNIFTDKKGNNTTEADLAVPGPSNQDFVDKQRETSIPFAAIASTPTLHHLLKQAKEIGNNLLLTGINCAPMTDILQEKGNKNIAKLNKIARNKVKE